jgi:hypothetical protein
MLLIFQVLNLVNNQHKLKVNNRNTSYNINTCIIAHNAVPYTLWTFYNFIIMHTVETEPTEPKPEV